MKTWKRALGALGLATLALSCSHSNYGIPHASCNPLGRGEGEDCLLPYPSDFYTRNDPSTATGKRVHLADAALPHSIFGTPIDSGEYDRRDGFSTVATLLAQFPASPVGIEPSGLPDSQHTLTALKPKSRIQILRADTLERVPLFAELDANADPRAGDAQALIIRAVERLKPSTRYIAVIHKLTTVDGKPLAPLTGFGQLRDRKVTENSRLYGWVDHYEEIFRRLAKAGVVRADIQLAWDFTTGSDEAVVGRLVRMRDLALKNAPKSPVTFTQVEKFPADAPELYGRIHASFAVPSFLEEGNGNRLRLGADGLPEVGTAQEFPLTIHVPRCVLREKGPVPLLIYGHGTFNTAAKEMNTEYSRQILDRLCMIEIGTDWLGRAHPDLSYYLTHVLTDWNNFQQITDRLQQAHVNVALLARLARSGKIAAALDAIPGMKRKNGRTRVDSSQVYYYGISEGGCQGVTALALSPDIKRGALNVPCGFWSMFFSRSSDFHKARWAMKAFYPGPLERQKLFALTQLLWDYTDPANYAPHVLRDPLPGSNAKELLYQEGINDASVPNLTTRAMARTLGLKLLSPYVEPVEGIAAARGPMRSAYAQFRAGDGPRLGGDNVPPAPNDVHENVRRLEDAKRQLFRFLRGDGMAASPSARL